MPDYGIKGRSALYIKATLLIQIKPVVYAHVKIVTHNVTDANGTETQTENYLLKEGNTDETIDNGVTE